MTDMIDEFDFSQSVGAEVAKEANKGVDFAREVEFLSLKADPASVSQGKDRAIIRLVTEHEHKPWMGQTMTRWSLPWITVKQHYAPTRPRPEWLKENASWPEKMFAVCRCDKVFAKKYNNTCEVCNGGSKATDRSWALAIEREQIIENGRVVGLRDKTREVFDRDANGDAIVISAPGAEKKEYQMKMVPAWLVLNFGYKNFFNGLAGQASYFQTVLGRDYVVRRTGMGNNDTTYSFVSLDPITITGEFAAAIGVPEGTPYDLGHTVATVDDGNGGQRSVPLSEVLYPDMPDLRRIVAERTSEDYYGRWFIPGWTPKDYTPGQNTGGASQGVQSGVQQGYQTPSAPAGQPTQPSTPVTPEAPAATSAAPSSDMLAALKARVAGQSQQ